MRRRQFNQASLGAFGALLLATYQQAWALSLGDLAGISNTDANNGLKAALEKGALAAVGLLGKTDGFLGNPAVRIPLPGQLDKMAKGPVDLFVDQKRIARGEVVVVEERFGIKITEILGLKV